MRDDKDKCPWTDKNGREIRHGDKLVSDAGAEYTAIRSELGWALLKDKVYYSFDRIVDNSKYYQVFLEVQDDGSPDCKKCKQEFCECSLDGSCNETRKQAVMGKIEKMVERATDQLPDNRIRVKLALPREWKDIDREELVVWTQEIENRLNLIAAKLVDTMVLFGTAIADGEGNVLHPGEVATGGGNTAPVKSPYTDTYGFSLYEGDRVAFLSNRAEGTVQVVEVNLESRWVVAFEDKKRNPLLLLAVRDDVAKIQD